MSITRWYAAVALAAALPVGLALAPASAATAATTSCPAAIVYGVHGTAEGPSSPADKSYSPTIVATFRAFRAEVKKLPNDGTSHTVQTQWVYYTAPSFADLTHPARWPSIVGTVDATATQLYNLVSAEADACTGTHIAVAGFSLGAWIINAALTQHYYMAGLTNLVLLEGDPCWSNTSDGSAGLVQRVPGAGTDLGCMDPASYPYLTFANPFTAQSLCVPKDPVCGEGFNLLTTPEQIGAAVQCGHNYAACPHSQYPTDGAAAYGGKWLADNIFT